MGHCIDCRFSLVDPECKLLECRRFPPVSVFDPNINSVDDFTVEVRATYWCGEHKPKVVRHGK